VLYTLDMTYDVYSSNSPENSAGEPLPKQPRPYIWLERLLLVAFAFCLLVGLTAFAVWWTLRNPDQPALGGDPLADVRTDQVLPQLALRQLAGDAADGLSVQALQAGQLEMARAILSYATDLSPTAQCAAAGSNGQRHACCRAFGRCT
jgi:hypothetical protein